MIGQQLPSLVTIHLDHRFSHQLFSPVIPANAGIQSSRTRMAETMIIAPASLSDIVFFDYFMEKY